MYRAGGEEMLSACAFVNNTGYRDYILQIQLLKDFF